MKTRMTTRHMQVQPRWMENSDHTTPRAQSSRATGTRAGGEGEDPQASGVTDAPCVGVAVATPKHSRENPSTCALRVRAVLVDKVLSECIKG